MQPDSNAQSAEEEQLARERQGMVQRQLRSRDIYSPRVLDVMGRIPRHKFIPPAQQGEAYADRPVFIGLGQTISQPYIVALMTQMLDPKPDQKILEIGAGSGYQTAILAELAGRVCAVEILEPLARGAEARLRALGYSNVAVRVGDGYGGWPEEAPFDGILVAAAANHVPPALKEQLAVGARLVIPVGVGDQRLLAVTRTQSGFVEETVLGVRFVPMTGEAEARGGQSN